VRLADENSHITTFLYYAASQDVGRIDPLLRRTTFGHVLREDREAMTCFHYENATGTIAAEYVVLTEFAGEFRIAPARVELMYKPTVGGHSSSFVMNVTEKKEKTKSR
jgi:hypothetical protein